MPGTESGSSGRATGVSNWAICPAWNWHLIKGHGLLSSKKSMRLIFPPKVQPSYDIFIIVICIHSSIYIQSTTLRETVSIKLQKVIVLMGGDLYYFK